MELPSIIGNNMVLQQQTNAAIWGWDAPGTKVTVAFRGNEASTKADLAGKWLVRIPTGTAGGPFQLKISGTNNVELSNVLVGEVWIAGGQSNMWRHVANCKDAKQEIESANHPSIRFWDANTSPTQMGWSAPTPQKLVKQAEWKITTPQTVKDFAGTPYFFARELHQKLHIPVGIVHLAVPGAEIEPFLSQEFVRVNLPQTIENWEYKKKDYPDLSPPGGFFNGMIYPTAPYTAKGFLWWQGESNARRSLQYQVLFPGLIQEWRHLWGKDDAPFLFVELANFLPRQTQPSEDDPWPALRDAQHAALHLANTYEISTIDILPDAEGVDSIHPQHKQLAGHRLYLAAIANVYGETNLIWSGPTYESADFQESNVTVTFNHTGSVLVAHGGELKGFALAGSDRHFSWAEA
ncbi:MAG: hypothetical protein JO235_28560, partial [Chroococcidiopsidaceae cyanobacterium CP_BM_RX_35]|nr:hypothetical protein [Chroococcidiopsidaceae cyanobacterium CP_BM_RX_35]